jgi:hypothetical protein
MHRRFPFFAAAVLIVTAAPFAHAQVADADARCKSEVTSRGYPGSFDHVQVNGSIVSGQVRTGNDVLAFRCLVDNQGNVSEVYVDRAYGVRNDLAPSGSDYKRGYRDGAVRSPYNNYSNSSAYDQGYEEGYQSRRRR